MITETAVEITRNVVHEYIKRKRRALTGVINTTLETPKDSKENGNFVIIICLIVAVVVLSLIIVLGLLIHCRQKYWAKTRTEKRVTTVVDSRNENSDIQHSSVYTEDNYLAPIDLCIQENRCNKLSNSNPSIDKQHCVPHLVHQPYDYHRNDQAHSKDSDTVLTDGLHPAAIYESPGSAIYTILMNVEPRTYSQLNEKDHINILRKPNNNPRRTGHDHINNTLVEAAKNKVKSVNVPQIVSKAVNKIALENSRKSSQSFRMIKKTIKETNRPELITKNHRNTINKSKTRAESFSKNKVQNTDIPPAKYQSKPITHEFRRYSEIPAVDEVKYFEVEVSQTLDTTECINKCDVRNSSHITYHSQLSDNCFTQENVYDSPDDLKENVYDIPQCNQ